jgi:hypothetical protein
MDDELISRIDAYAEMFQKEHPGVSLSRGGAIRLLCEKGLATVASSTSTVEGAPSKAATRARRKTSDR